MEVYGNIKDFSVYGNGDFNYIELDAGNIPMVFEVKSAYSYETNKMMAKLIKWFNIGDEVCIKGSVSELKRKNGIRQSIG